MKKSGKPAIFGLILATLVVAGGLAFEGCGGGGDPGANEVFMQAIAFNPMEITIQAGESVTWINQDIVPHTATSGNPGDEDLGAIFRSAQFGQGGTFTHTFNDEGEFVYFCEVHPGMMRDAKVIVESAN
ncbi:MAG: plastocyanin/azurin family copper-binding protein [Planctomycetota bacterium]|nr:plastocyanin/azurin family copper-binding protein [Planctomycetota bacterium]